MKRKKLTNMKTTINEYKELKNAVNKFLDIYLTPDELSEPEIIWKSMRYSVLADGKRLRPILVLETAKQCAKEKNIHFDIEKVMPVACAIEMIHAQSLIHDDLPCMDNDDFRRGNPTNHKVFGEANAVLAGDALISYAVSTIIKHLDAQPEIKIKIIDEIMKTAGVEGIIAGQVVDIDSEGKEITEKTLNFIHNYKTASMFKTAIRCGAILMGCDEIKLNNLTILAETYGLAFQIKDDILDVTETLEKLGKTPGKDADANKATYIKFYGLDGAKEKLNSLCEKTYDIIDKELNQSKLMKYIVNNLRVG